MPREPTASHVPLGSSTKRGANFDSVAMSIDVLLVECTGCNRRAALDRDDAPIRQGNINRVQDAQIQMPQVRADSVRSCIPLTQDEVDMFLAGDPLPEARRVM